MAQEKTLMLGGPADGYAAISTSDVIYVPDPGKDPLAEVINRAGAVVPQTISVLYRRLSYQIGGKPIVVYYCADQQPTPEDVMWEIIAHALERAPVLEVL